MKTHPIAQEILKQHELLPLWQQKAEIDKEKQRYISEISEEYDAAARTVINAMVKDAKVNNINYVEHKLKEEDIINLIKGLVLYPWDHNKTVKAIVNDVWLQVGKNYHPEWVKKVKNRSYGNFMKSVLNKMKRSKEYEPFHEALKEIRMPEVNFNGTLNVTLNSIYRQIDNQNYRQYQEREIEELKIKLAMSESQKELLIAENANLTKGLVSKKNKEWHSIARKLKSQGFSNTEIGKVVGKSRETVSRYFSKIQIMANK